MKQFPKIYVRVLQALMTLLIAPMCFAQGAITSTENSTTTVYKQINEDGSIVFSDSALPNSRPVEIESVPIVPAFKIPKSAKQQAKQEEQPFSYDSFNIIEPSNHSSFHSGNGNVNVLLNLQPALRPEHSIKIVLNQQTISTQRQLGLALNNISRGTHQLEAHIITFSGEEIKSTYSTFTVHRPIVRRN